MTAEQAIVTSDIPARLDRLPWGRFHVLVVAALGVTWILDGLEVTLAGSLAGALKDSPMLRFGNADVGFAASAYLAGAVLGAVGMLAFGIVFSLTVQHSVAWAFIAASVGWLIVSAAGWCIRRKMRIVRRTRIPRRISAIPAYTKAAKEKERPDSARRDRPDLDLETRQ